MNAGKNYSDVVRENHDGKKKRPRLGGLFSFSRQDL